MLKLYREKHQGRLPGSISTFGFGYGVKSLLLRDLAEVGGGMYAFIPDSGFVGTAFVNALANQLATMGTHATLSVELPAQLLAALPGDSQGQGHAACVLGQPRASCLLTSWGVAVDLGHVQFGQRKDVVLRLPLPAGESAHNLAASGDFLATFSFTPLSLQGLCCDVLCYAICRVVLCCVVVLFVFGIVLLLDASAYCV